MRICVEIDLDVPLQPKIFARGYLLNIQYEGFHFSCGKHDHKDTSCGEKLTVI